MPDPLTSVPATLTAGDSLSVTLSFSDYPASAGWTAALYLRGPSALDVTGTAVGDQHGFVVTGTASANLTPGSYVWGVRLTSGATTHTADTGRITLRPNLATAAAGALQSYAEQQLAVCQQARANILAGEMKLYMIGGRQVQLHTLDDLRREESYWQTRVQMERGAGFGRPVLFTVAGLR